MAGYIAKAKRTDWRTPKHVIDAVKTCFDGAIDLDPCASDNPENWFAETNYCLANNQDGLALNWDILNPEENTGVYCNPPFGRGINKWIEKAYNHEGPVIMLIPASVDTKVWHNTIFPSACICFLEGRLKFELDGRKATPAPMACAVIGFNVDPIKFRESFQQLGYVVT